MKRYICAIVMVMGLLIWLTEPALASCTTNTITTGDGRMLTCTTCCYGSAGCQTSCY